MMLDGPAGTILHSASVAEGAERRPGKLEVVRSSPTHAIFLKFSIRRRWDEGWEAT